MQRALLAARRVAMPRSIPLRTPVGARRMGGSFHGREESYERVKEDADLLRRDSIRAPGFTLAFA